MLIEMVLSLTGSAYLLHEFAIMPDHTTFAHVKDEPLRTAAPFIKNSFCLSLKKVLGSNPSLQPDFRIIAFGRERHRIHQIYVQQNPVRKHL